MRSIISRPVTPPVRLNGRSIGHKAAKLDHETVSPIVGVGVGVGVGVAEATLAGTVARTVAFYTHAICHSHADSARLLS
jgi:hypothetical protein